MNNLFDRLNKETFAHNNGLSRNISPTAGCGRVKASDLLANFNNHTYKMNNGQFPERRY